MHILSIWGGRYLPREEIESFLEEAKRAREIHLKKTTLLIVFALFLSVCSILLPWINDELTGVAPQRWERAETWYWSFMQRTVFLYRYNTPPQTSYRLFDQLWRNRIWETLPDPGYLVQILVAGSVNHYAEGYYVIFLFQLLTVLFQSICITIDRWDAPILQLILYPVTFIISIGAPIVGINQYIQDWGRRDFVQLSIGFYLAVVSSVLTLTYGLIFIIKIFRK